MRKARTTRERRIKVAAREVADEIIRRGDMTFPLIDQFLVNRGFETKGDWELSVIPNGVLWANMSKDFLDIIHAVQDDHGDRVMWDTCHFLIYLMDGVMIHLPLAQREPRDLKKGFAEPKWIPVIFRPRNPAKDGKRSTHPSIAV